MYMYLALRLRLAVVRSFQFPSLGPCSFHSLRIGLIHYNIPPISYLFISFFSCCCFSTLSFTAARLGIHVRFFCTINLYAALHLGLLSLMFVSISLHLH